MHSTQRGVGELSSSLLDRLRQWYERTLSVRLADKTPPVLLVFLYMSARISGGSFLHFLLRVTVILTASCFLWTRAMRKNLQCIYEADRTELTRGESVTLTMRFDNEGFLPIAHLRARSRIPGSSDPKEARWNVATTVPSLQSRLIRQETVLNHNGHYRLGPVDVTVGDPLGWFRSSLRLYGHRYLTVFPRILPVRGTGLPLRRPFGSLRTRFRAFADPSNLSDIHPMQPGDNPRHIHWPTTARMGEPYVREFELTASGEVHIVVDLSRSQPAGDKKDADTTGTFGDVCSRETAFDLAAGLAESCLRNDLAVGLVARAGDADYSRPTGKGPQQMANILRSLARSRVNCPIPTDLLLQQVGHQLGSGSTMLVVTGTLSPSVHSRLSSLVQMGIGVGVFLVRTQQARKSVTLSTANGWRSGSFRHRTRFSLWTVSPGTSVVDLGQSAPRRPHAEAAASGGRMKRITAGY